MAVKIRLQRAGKKKQPLYRIVAANSRAPRDGKFLEVLGQYNPRTNPMTINVKEERIFHWMENGAKPTDTAKSLLSRKGIMLKWALKKKKADETTIATEFEKWKSLQEAKLQRENEKKLRRKIAAKKKAAEKTETKS